MTGEGRTYRDHLIQIDQCPNFNAGLAEGYLASHRQYQNRVAWGELKDPPPPPHPRTRSGPTRYTFHWYHATPLAGEVIPGEGNKPQVTTGKLCALTNVGQGGNPGGEEPPPPMMYQVWHAR